VLKNKKDKFRTTATRRPLFFYFMARFQPSKPHKFGKTACVVTIRHITGSVRGIVHWGARGIRVEIECHISDNLPATVIVGSASKSVDEAKEHVRAIFANAGLQLPRKRITINLAPADLPKTDSMMSPSRHTY